MDGAIDFSDSKFLHLRCQYDPDDSHIFRNPKKLECGNIFCADCIKKFVNEKKNCKCEQKHENVVIENLETVTAKVDEINQKATEITEEIISKLVKFAGDMKGTHEEREAKITKLCDHVRADIGERVIQIKAHLDKLHDELKTQLKEIKAKVYQELEKLNKEVSEKTTQYQQFSDKMEKMLGDFENNKEQLQKDIYTCQDHIEELKRLDENFHKILRKVSFEPSDWTPDASYIGTFSCPELFENDDEDDEDESDMEQDEQPDQQEQPPQPPAVPAATN